MLKQQQLQSTEPIFFPSTNPSLEQSALSLSINFKERINRLKAKGKPCLIPNNNALTQLSPMENIQQSKREKENFMKKYMLNGNKIVGTNVRTVSENKVIDMKVSYRKEALHFKKKSTKQGHQSAERSGDKSQRKGQFGKLNLQIFQNITLQERKSSFANYNRNQEVGKENIQNNCFEIQDILINASKSSLNTQRCNKLTSKAASFSKGHTIINVRDFKTKNSVDLLNTGLKKNIEKSKIKKVQTGTKLIKTQCQNYQTK